MANFTKKYTNQSVVFYLKGRFSLEDLANLRKAFWDCLHCDNINKLVIDFKAMKRIDYSVFSLLTTTQNMTLKKKCRLMICGLNPHHYAMLRKVNLHHYFNIYKRVEDALSNSQAQGSATSEACLL